jgi:NAD(P)-dependent dehydrogenase (short-subunit alcohol dehydrogenase family)
VSVAVVTGGGQGLGRAIALAFAGAGYSVAVAGRTRSPLDAVAAEIAGLAVPCDVGDVDSVGELGASVLESLGVPDVLVCNAGVAGPTAVLWEQDPSDWDATFRVNVNGVYLCCRAFLPGMVARGSGSVIVIGSMTGKRPLHGRTPYAASKTALTGLVRTLAWEAGAFGVRVNLISPGAIAGPRLDGVIARQAEARGISVEESLAAFTSSSPLGRVVPAEDVASAALYLATASSVTGEDLNVSAGTVGYG